MFTQHTTRYARLVPKVKLFTRQITSRCAYKKHYSQTNVSNTTLLINLIILTDNTISRWRKAKQKHNTLCVGHHYTQKHIKKVNKTPALKHYSQTNASNTTLLINLIILTDNTISIPFFIDVLCAHGCYIFRWFVLRFLGFQHLRMIA
jgi:hypothetical protein